MAGGFARFTLLLEGLLDDEGVRATGDSWKISPLPDARARLAFANRYSAEDYARLACGFIPTSMDDRWFAYLAEGWLSFHRSWTGHCIYRVRFAREGEGYRAVEAWANRDPAQFRRADDAADVGDLERLIEHLLLGWAYLTPE